MRACVLAIAAAAACLNQPKPQGVQRDAAPDVAIDAPADAAEPPNYMFATSRGSSAATLADADAWCGSLAGSAAIPGRYVAWLSDATTNAKDRISGARGWIRPDGLPFADTADDIATGQLFYPPDIDESQGLVQSQILTGTLADGTASPGGQFGDVNVTTGEPDGGVGVWSDSGNTLPDVGSLFYCFQIDHQAVVAPPRATTSLVFLSVGTQPGDAGVAAFDLTCTSEYQAKLGSGAGSAVALVATDTTSAGSRLVLGHGPWVRPDGVAAIRSDAMGLLAPIEITLAGQHVASAAQVWTGAATLSSIAAGADACSGNWGTTGGTGSVGSPNRSGGTALANGSAACNTAHPLYCAVP
jgi:hypothetical protein